MSRRRERPGSVQRVGGSTLQQAQMREGDFRLPNDSRNRWGRIEQLFYNAGTSGAARRLRVAPFVETPVQTEPQQFAIELRAGFSLETLSPIVPMFALGQEYTLRVRVHRGIDIQKGSVEDVYTLGPNGIDSPIARLPVSCVLAQQLGIYVELNAVGADAPLPMWVQVVVAIVNAGCCSGADGGGYSNARIERFEQDTNSQLFLPANAARRQFVVQNHGTGFLYLGFSTSVTTPGGSSPAWTVALDEGEVYESNPGAYAGPVSGAWETADATKYAMVTEGT